jgi:hypothetical protein
VKDERLHGSKLSFRRGKSENKQQCPSWAFLPLGRSVQARRQAIDRVGLPDAVGVLVVAVLAAIQVSAGIVVDPALVDDLVERLDYSLRVKCQDPTPILSLTTFSPGGRGSTHFE